MEFFLQEVNAQTRGRFAVQETMRQRADVDVRVLPTTRLSCSGENRR